MTSIAATYVLVHGAWRGGWCYERVAELLRARGHRVFTPTLTGLGERSHLASLLPINFSTHVQDIVNVLLWEDLHNVVLCGHSYAGMIITAVADAMPERIAALVHLDAVIPEAGKSLLDMNKLPAVVAGLLKETVAAGGQLAPPLPAALFGTNAADLERADRLCTPHPFASFCEPVALTGEWLKVAKKTYVRATGWQGYDRLGFLSFQGIVDDAGWIKVDVPCGHEIMLDAPAALAQILVDAA